MYSVLSYIQDSVIRSDFQCNQRFTFSFVFMASSRAKPQTGSSAASDLEELSEQYEYIMEECGHGKFQWMLFIVLGLALMADGVECFVVAFVLPSAEKDLCLSNAEKGMLGKH